MKLNELKIKLKNKINNKSEKEKAALQKIISMLEDTDKFESGEYSIIIPNIRGVVYTLESNSVRISFRKSEHQFPKDLFKIDISINEKTSLHRRCATLYLTDEEASNVKEKFEEVYNLLLTALAFKEEKEEIDKFLDL